MSNEYFTASGSPSTRSTGSSAVIRGEFTSLQNAFDKLPTLAASGGYFVRVNAGATALESISAATARTGLGIGSIATQNANNVAITGGSIASNNVTLTGGTITGVSSLGTNNIAVTGGSITGLSSALAEASGGTNQNTYITGDLIYASANNRLNKLAVVAAGNVLISGSTPSWNKVDLVTHVNNVLARGSGGTGLNAAGAANNVLVSDGTNWVSGLPNLTSKIQPIDASIGTNALTLTINPTILDFRSSTLGNGVVNTRTVSAAVSLVVNNTATLGTVANVAARLAVIGIDNAGTVEPAVVNLSGGVVLDETGIISTVTLNTASNSNTVVYSTTARNNVPYRVVGFVDSNQVAAGIYAAPPTTIQGTGGEALGGMSSIGYGQTWQDMTGSRAFATTYYNTTGKPIHAYVNNTSGGATLINPVVGGITLGGANAVGIASFIVPPGMAYSVSGGTLQKWFELR